MVIFARKNIMIYININIETNFFSHDLFRLLSYFLMLRCEVCNKQANNAKRGISGLENRPGSPDCKPNINWPLKFLQQLRQILTNRNNIW